MNRTLSVPEWCQIVKEGTNLPVRIPLMGWSMFPLIRYNRDYVTVMPVENTLQIGDIVLFPDPYRENVYVMHRIWSIKDDLVQTWGDNSKRPDKWIQAEEILGKAVLIERGKRRIKPDPSKGIRWAKFWHQAGKIYRPLKGYKNGLISRIKKLTA